jgi:tetratricopeptide (TPR) repeat protein
MHRFILLLFICSPLLVPAQEPAPRQEIVSTSQRARELYASGSRLQANGDLIAARDLFLSALREDPYFVAAMNQLAENYRRSGQLDSTIYYYRQSIANYPRDLRAQQGLAAAYQLADQPQAAIDQYHALLRQFPGYPEAYYGLAQVYMGLNQYGQVISNAETAMRWYLAGENFEPAADARHLAGLGYLNSGDPKRAIKYFKANAKYFSGRPFYHYYLGLAYLQAGKAKDARRQLDQARALGYDIPDHIQNRLSFLEQQ